MASSRGPALEPWLVLPSVAAPGSFSRLLSLGERADAAGWHTLCVADSALALGFHDSTVALAALAARTSHARLAVACMSTLGLRHPLIVAQQWANLDALSEGRVTLIACPGNRTGARHERELAAFGIGYEEKVARMEEYVEVIREASRSSHLDFDGRFLTVAGVHLQPGFTQRPLPIWLTGNPSAGAGPLTLARVLGRVARLGDGWLTYNIRPSHLGPRIRQLHELRGDRLPVAVQVYFTLADTRPQAVAEAREAWATSATRGISATELTEVFAIGTAHDVLARLDELARAGATAVALSPLGRDPAEQIRRATDEVLPVLLAARSAMESV